MVLGGKPFLLTMKNLCKSVVFYCCLAIYAMLIEYENYVQILIFSLYALAAIMYDFNKKTIIHAMKRPCHHTTATDKSFWFTKSLIQHKLKCSH
jgi:hypothetical protein